ncbi:MAG: hypothetical protein KGL39_34595 [Patescibacteria group bacterium]|nr:hypothetical protein [Patescibacteria group bacterium]
MTDATRLEAGRETDKTYLYLGRAPCGCIVAATVDYRNKSTADDVAEFIRDGYSVERIEGDRVKLGHTCGKRP